ncbi:mitochondrial processing peptidase beta subunit [Cryptosporidium parvum]|uniref:Mitochondrial processing peptidase beta subunit n=1 Tax=Cryptosporidium parvum TaxID=5807 RepID=A0A7S7RGF1_CRYPV|nr:Insulinase (Peptidase family M16) [Cryptosporidium parvum]WKS78085.1 mitochondrial processing peptidase beta subunit [Cryptosporidium sp. 43IA8]WRK32577.1 Insulinase (Peptidase family M16) [Cryptosporidium parvum]|eukprot:QOY41863.1 hypothetical protein CPATCC_002468 [Cryptosporidium parvum]
MSLILKNSILKLGCSNLLRVLPTRYARFNSTLSFKRNDPDLKISKLSNGMRVATMKFGIDSIPNSLTFGLWVDSGSRNEDPGKNGIAHFLEHLIFKGTYNRSRKEIESQIEDLGAHLNAYTTREQTVYQIRCFNQDLPKCMDLLSDIIKNSKFCKSAIEQEKGVVLREMEEVSKSEEEIIFDDLHKEMYKNHPLGNTILGPKENILGFKREDLINYIRTNYIPEKMMILGVGNIDHNSFKNIAETYFGNDSNNSRNLLGLKGYKNINLSNSQYLNEINSDKNHPVLVHKKNNSDGKTLLAMAYNGTSWNSKDFLKVMFLQSMLGEYGTNNINRVTGYKNQIIERILSGIKDHVEFFETFNTCYKDTGLFGWYLKSNSDLSHKAIMENAKLISSRFKNLHSLITEDDIIRVKRILSYQLTSLYENSGTLFEEIGRDLIVNNHYTSIDDKLKQIQQIDLEGIKEIIHKYFNFNPFY